MIIIASDYAQDKDYATPLRETPRQNCEMLHTRVSRGKAIGGIVCFTGRPDRRRQTRSLREKGPSESIKVRTGPGAMGPNDAGNGAKKKKAGSLEKDPGFAGGFYETRERRAPPAAENPTTIQGGRFQTASRPKAARARQKSAGLFIAFVHTGS